MAGKLNKDRILKTADGYIRSGKVEKAVAEYEKWVGANPKDWNTIRQIGDLYARIGKNDQAIRKYTQIAEYYRTDGFNVRAIATYKMILRLEPQNEPAMANLADLQVAQGLLMEAKSQYQTLVELYNKSGQKRRAAEVFKKLAEIDPSDLKVRYKFAEFLDRHGQVEEAIAEYVGIADEFINNGLVPEAMQIMEKGLRIDSANRSLRCKLAQATILQGDYPKAIQLLGEVRDRYPDDVELLSRLGEAYMGAGNTDDAEAIFRRLAELEPDNPEHSSRLAELAVGQGRHDQALQILAPSVDRFVENGDGDKAAALLRKIIQREPHHVKTLLKLAEIHTILKQEQARGSAYDQLCEAYSHHGDYDRAARVAEQLIELEPENSQHKDRLRFLKSRLEPVVEEESAPAPAPAPTAEPEIALPDLESIEASDDLVDVISESAPALSLGEGPRSESTADEVITLSQEDEEHIKEKLTEAEVFVRYGLVEKAIDQLKDVLQSFGFHTESREKLVEIYKDQGMNREAAEEMVQLARVYERLGQSDQSRQLLEDARALNPTLSEPAETGALGAEEEIELTLTPDEDVLETDLIAEPDGAEFGEEIPVEEEDLLPEEISTSLTSEAESPPSAEAEIDLPLEEVELELDAEEAPLEGAGAAEPLPTLGQDEIEIAEEFAVPNEIEVSEDLAVSEEFKVSEDLEVPEKFEVTEDLEVLEDPAAVGVEEEVFDLEDDATEFMSEPSMEAGFGEGEIDLDLPPSAAPPAEEEILQDQPEIASEAMPELIEEADESFPVEEQVENVPMEMLPAAAETEPAPAGSDLAEPPQVELSGSAGSELVEVDEYIALGLYEDARDTLRELLIARPGDQAILAKIEELGFSVSQLQEEAESAGEAVVSQEPVGQVVSHPIGFQPLTGVAASAEAPLAEEPLASVEGFGEPEPAGQELASATGEAGAESYVDLASELSQEIFGTQSAVEEATDAAPGTITDPGLEEIFREFKKGVEKQLGSEDYDTRYNLGIAYKEMGLLDEAIAEFQLASKDETRLLECCSMLGLCFLEKGMPEIAIKWFEKGQGAPGRSDEEYNGLRYDLAQAHEAAGNTERALELYMDIYRVNARFRDVRERVRGLQAAKH